MTAFTAARHVANSRAADHQQAEGDAPGAGCCRASARLFVAFRAALRPSAPFFGRVGVVLRLRPLRSRAGGLCRCRRPLMSLAPPTPSPPLGVPFPVSAAAVAGRPPFPAGLF